MKALVLGIKLSGLIVRDHPDGPDRSAINVEGHQQPFDQQRVNVGELRVGHDVRFREFFGLEGDAPNFEIN